MSREIKSWSVTRENVKFLETRAYVEEVITTTYQDVGQERVVSSTVFYPLKKYVAEGVDPKILQVWVTPRHGDRVIVKVAVKGEGLDYDDLMQAERAFDKIVSSLRPVMGRGKVNII